MDSQECSQLLDSQNLSDDTNNLINSESPPSKDTDDPVQNNPQNLIISDSKNTDNPAQNNPQNHPMPKTTLVFQPGANQFIPWNPQFQPNFPFNPMSVPYPPFYVQHQFGNEPSVQGLTSTPRQSLKSRNSDSFNGTPKKGGISKKKPQISQTLMIRRWTVEEDIALTKAWLYVSVDADVSKDQKAEAMWIRIHKAWKDNMGGECDESRKTNALACRWNTINAAVSKFQGLYERLERRPRNGITPEDMKKEAMKMYKELSDGQLFKFEHCWEIMKTNPKWCSQQRTQMGVSKKRKLINDSSVVTPPTSPKQESLLHQVDSNGVDNLVAEIPNCDGIVSPLGRKGTKKKKKRISEDTSVIDILGRLQRTLDSHLNIAREQLELKGERSKKEFALREQTMKMEMEFKERKQKLKEKAQKRKVQERILNQDVTKLQPALREAFERMQGQILKEWQDDGLFGEVTRDDDMVL